MRVFKTENGRMETLTSYDTLLERWNIETEEVDIEGRYGTTHVIKAGSPDLPPLLLFHGVGDNSAMMWLHNAGELSGSFRIYAVDAIGGPGKSIPGPEYGRGFSQGNWIEELMDSLGLGKASAAGVSYGCYLVQYLLAELPNRIEKAVGMAGSIAIRGAGSATIRMIKAFFPEALFPNDKNVLRLINKLTGENRVSLTNDADLMTHWKLLLKNFNNMAMGFHRIDKFSDRQIGEIRKNLLLLIGDQDILAYNKKSVEILEMTGIEYEIFKGCGHSINHEKPDEINERIRSFILGL